MAIGEPFHCASAPELKPVPLMVSQKLGPPAVTVVGEQFVITGTAVVMVKVACPERYPPGLTTVMVAVPVLAIKLAGTVAVNCVELTSTVVRAEPFHCTWLPATKALP